MLSLDTPGSDSQLPLLKCAGNFSKATPGVHVYVRGTTATHKKYGEQLNATYIQQTPPLKAEDFKTHLSNAAPDLDAIVATRIVQTLGRDKTVALLDSANHEGLARFAGLSRPESRHICQQWQTDRHSAEILAICHALGLRREQVLKVLAHYKDGHQVIEGARALRINPFRLASIGRLKFSTLDTVSRDLGVNLMTPERIDSAMLSVLALAGDKGHTFLQSGFFADHVLSLCNDNTPPAQCVSVDLLSRRIAIASSSGALNVSRDNRAVALAAAAEAERRMAKNIVRLHQGSASVEPSYERLMQALGDFTPSPEQANAFQVIMANKVALLAGNPGTGKTTITKNLLSGFPPDTRVLMLAPTGQAADRLAEASGRPAQTIHLSLAELKRDNRQQYQADLIVVDEFSMVNVETGDQLFQAIPDEARVVLTGDPNQLPAIGAGNILQDILASWVPRAHLSEVLRQKSQSGILDVATAIRSGRIPFRGRRNQADALFIPAQSDYNCVRHIVRIVDRLVQEGTSREAIQVLVPARRTQCGTQRLNLLLRPLLNAHAQANERSLLHIRDSDVRPGDRVRHIKNDYEFGLMNGANGTVLAVDPVSATVTADFGGETFDFDVEHADNLLLDYAATIHRSQGSQYPVTIVGVSRSPRQMLERRLIYTAVTRAEKQLVVVAEPQILNYAIKNNPNDGRQTFLRACLADQTARQTPSFEGEVKSASPAGRLE